MHQLEVKSSTFADNNGTTVITGKCVSDVHSLRDLINPEFLYKRWSATCNAANSSGKSRQTGWLSTCVGIIVGKLLLSFNASAGAVVLSVDSRKPYKSYGVCV